MRDNKRFKVRVGKTEELKGCIKAPPSKSYTHRAVMVSSINGRTKIINPLYSQDTLKTISMMKKLGAEIEKKKDYLIVKGVSGKPNLEKKRVLNVGESGTLLRFILPLIALAKGKYVVKGKGTLSDRPNDQIIDALRSWEVNIRGKGNSSKLPIIVEANGVLKGGEVQVSGKMSSQVVSSLLIAAPFAQNDTTVIMKNELVSRPYVDITIDVLKWAGIKVQRKKYDFFKVKGAQRITPKSEYVVRGDYSSAAFLIAAAILVKSDVTITDLANDRQPDKRFIDIVRKMGAGVRRRHDAIRVRGPYKLHGVEVDCSDTPDIVPILAVLAAFAEGETRICNIHHLVYKESDRIASTVGQLKKLGAKISYTDEKLVIQGVPTLQSGSVSSCNDHRIAMALAVAALRNGGVTIDNAQCISKSYPLFLSHLKKLHANLEVLPKN